MLNTLRTLTASERAVLLSALPFVLVVRVALWVLPSRLIVRRVQQMAANTSTARSPVRSPGEIAWAIEAAARRVPRASCLTQAVAAQYLLRRSGHASELRVGVARGESGFRAHAWIEHDGRILVGGLGSAAFTPLPGFVPASARAVAAE